MRSISKFVPFNSSIWKFLTFNTGLPLFDMGTDFRTFFFYLSVASFHPNWAMLTLGWILVSSEIPKPRYISNRRYRMFFQDTKKYHTSTFWCGFVFTLFLKKGLQNIAKYCRTSAKYRMYRRYHRYLGLSENVKMKILELVTFFLL